MKPYTDYEYYKIIFKGNSIPEDSFEKIVIEASRKVNYYVPQKLVEVTNLVKDTTCSVAELLYIQNELKSEIKNTKEKASETVGPRSVTYVNNLQYKDKQILSDNDLNKMIYKICREHLLDAGLMKRGVYNNVSP